MIGNKKEYTYLYLDRQACQEHNFKSIGELSVRCQIRSRDYAQNPLYSTDSVLFSFERNNSRPTG